MPSVAHSNNPSGSKLGKRNNDPREEQIPRQKLFKTTPIKGNVKLLKSAQLGISIKVGYKMKIQKFFLRMQQQR